MGKSGAELKKVACAAIDKAAEDLNTLSQDIWSHPELCFEETHAHDAICDFMEKYGFNMERKFKIDTAFRAVVGHKEEGQAHVSVLCEYDALPEVGHACGHNLIAECGVATGIGIKAAMDAAGKNIGKLSVIGTPAEEGGNGKEILMEKGSIVDTDFSMMAHPTPYNWSRVPMFNCLQEVEVTFKGRASHAAGGPWEGINALDAAVMAYQNISVLRQQMKPTWRVHGIFTKGGAKPNIIPEEAALFYYVRAPVKSELEVLKKKIEACFQAAAIATGCEIEVDWHIRPYLNVITNETLIKLYEHHSKDLGVKFETETSKGGGSTDMGNVSYRVPAIHPCYRIGEAMNHTRDFTSDAGRPQAQQPTLITAKALAMTAIDILMDEKLIKQMKADFEEDKKKHDA